MMLFDASATYHVIHHSQMDMPKCVARQEKFTPACWQQQFVDQWLGTKWKQWIMRFQKNCLQWCWNSWFKINSNSDWLLLNSAIWQTHQWKDGNFCFKDFEPRCSRFCFQQPFTPFSHQIQSSTLLPWFKMEQLPMTVASTSVDFDSFIVTKSLFLPAKVMAFAWTVVSWWHGRSKCVILQQFWALQPSIKSVRDVWSMCRAFGCGCRTSDSCDDWFGFDQLGWEHQFWNSLWEHLTTWHLIN